jgi:hypothetical protein
MKGYVYILTNKSLDGLIKIGMTTNSPYERASQLSTTGLPYPFEVYGFIQTDAPAETEKAVHKKLRSFRVSDKREFFQIEPSEALAIVEELTGKEECIRKKRLDETAKKEKLRRVEKEQNEKTARLKREWSELFDSFRSKTNEERYQANSDDFATVSKILLACTVLLFFVSARDHYTIAMFGLLIITGGLSIYYSIASDKETQKRRNLANQTMIDKYGLDWDKHWK